ncbi:hypothetical protein KP509_26G057400 [Ceratopteris richardii]|uniref:Uncharacterized protein n=1 Tax=Ceratopteris richardii TaxID=49495 RepID=A0A8T2RNC2_CERRI|nr:hypothetical protein KP509_26G057400 [Ceratopteris richardii]
MGLRSFAALFVCALLLSDALSAVEANCKVKNDSGKEVIIIPVEVDITIKVDVGATVDLPPEQQNCYFKNPKTGDKKGPVKLKDHGTYVCKDGVEEGTIDVYVGVYILGILQLGAKIFISL